MCDISAKNDVRLRVEELEKDRSGRRLCWVDAEVVKNMSLETGDIIEIFGKKNTSGIIVSSNPDRGKGTIKFDGLLRINSGSAIGEFVNIRKAIVSDAQEVSLSPTRSGFDLRGQGQTIKTKLIDKPIVIGDIVEVVGSMIQTSEGDPMEEFAKMFSFVKGSKRSRGTPGILRLKVENVVPADRVVKITRETKIRINKRVALLNVDGEIITYDDVGGLSDEIQKIREMVELPLKHPELFQRLNIEPPKGVLFYGPSGTGKTLMAKAVSQESSANFITINGPEIMSKFYGASEERLRNVFEDAKNNAPSIIFIDEIDSIAPKRSEAMGEVERRVVSQLLSLMDGLAGRGKVICIGATNRINSLDEALRRPGRFDREIEFSVPDSEGRKEILQIHTRGMPLEDDVRIDYYAEITYGFVGADLMAVCREAAMFAMRRILPEINLDEPIPAEIIQKLIITDEDFTRAINSTEPSAMREIMIEIPHVNWDDVGGLEEIKQELKEAVEWPLFHHELFKKVGIRAINGILLFGPPGCGKTLLAKAIATESKCNFISIKGPEIFSKWVGESEKAVREIFRKARLSSPSIIYFDEVDAITSGRGNSEGTHVFESIVNQILVEMDGLEKREGTVVIASTNRPDLVDPALLRPGRFDRLLFCPAPELQSRLKILEVHTKNMPLDSDVSLDKVASQTDGYSGADLENLVREAGMQAMREKMDDFEVVEWKHFSFALNKVKSSLSQGFIAQYEELAKKITSSRNIEERHVGLYK